MFLDGYEWKFCEGSELPDVLADCLIDAMLAIPRKPGSVLVPMNLNLRYSEKRGLVLTIQNFFISIPSFSSPPGKDEVVRTIREVYKDVFETSGIRLNIGEIRETIIADDREYGLEIEMFSPQ